MALARACLTPEERDGGHITKRAGRFWQRQSSGTPIGTGDRFSAGTIAPRGLGTQSSASFSTILNVNEVSSGFKALASTYSFPTFTAPYTTFEGRSIYGGLVGGPGTCKEAYRAYFNAAIHARERGSSDGLLYFMSDLLYANKNGVGLTYGKKTYTNAQVKTALSVGIAFVPLSNPDGVAVSNFDTHQILSGSVYCSMSHN